MRKLFSVVYYEYKMLFSRWASFGVLLGATLLSLPDIFPSAGNLRRLEFLNQPSYFICRVISIESLVLVFGLMFLLAGRYPLDAKTGMKHLLLSLPVRKHLDFFGKLLGGFLYTVSMLCIFLVCNTVVYLLAAPFQVTLSECIVPFAKAVIVSVFPVSFFISVCSVSLPGIIDIRLFYILAAILFGCNAAYVSSADPMPFYLITSGDLIRLIWVHPAFPFYDTTSILANWIFLMGSGVVSALLVFFKQCFRRSK